MSKRASNSAVMIRSCIFCQHCVGCSTNDESVVIANTVGVPNAVVNRDTDMLNELVSPVIANTQIIDSIILLQKLIVFDLLLLVFHQGALYGLKVDSLSSDNTNKRDVIKGIVSQSLRS